MSRWVALSFLSLIASAQNPCRVAADHDHLAFENRWARATRVIYSPHGQAPVHDHPPTPTTVYVYVTDGGPIRFHHVTGEHVAGHTITRPAVKAGAIRFAHGAPDDVRLPPAVFEGTRSSIQNQFENGQVRILRVLCESAGPCPTTAHPSDPAIVVALSGPPRGEIEWSPRPASGPAELVRIELKTVPVGDNQK